MSRLLRFFGAVIDVPESHPPSANYVLCILRAWHRRPPLLFSIKKKHEALESRCTVSMYCTHDDLWLLRQPVPLEARLPGNCPEAKQCLPFKMFASSTLRTYMQPSKQPTVQESRSPSSSSSFSSFKYHLVVYDTIVAYDTGGVSGQKAMTVQYCDESVGGTRLFFSRSPYILQQTVYKTSL